MEKYILEMEHISKEFSGVKALDDVTFRVKQGEIHALVGENGAGKSTLMKVLSGVYANGQYSGRMLVDGEEQVFENTKDAERAGIAIIYQELNLIKGMTICENIFLGNEINNHGIIHWNEQYSKTFDLIRRVKLNESPTTVVGTMGVGKQQLVEIAKALNKKAKIIILDEPTASLTEIEVGILLDILRELKRAGTTCIYISHKLEEVFAVADRVTVLRDGKTIDTQEVSETNEEKLIALMVGRELTQRYPYALHEPRETVMKVRNWSVPNKTIPGKYFVHDVSLDVRAGEILGIAGLMGAGRTELAMSIFGAMKIENQGKLFIDGKECVFRSPRQAINGGISYVSEDRKNLGLILEQQIQENMSLASMDKLTHLGVINRNLEITQSIRYMNDLRIKASSVQQKVKKLSGGNQQKVVLAKWILTQPKILIMDEPTRGVDVGAKFEIYQIMNQLVAQGIAIVMISSELPEILGMSDRIYVMHEGRITGELNRAEATQEKILFYAAGGNGEWKN